MSNRPTHSTLTEANDYLAGRAEWTALSDPEKTAKLQLGAQYLTLKYTYKGVLADWQQVLPFPRTGLYDREGRVIEGIPQAVKDAEAELAFIAIGDSLYKNDSSGGIKSTSVTVGAISKSTTYIGAKEMQTTYTIVDELLADFIESNGSSGQVTIDRA